MSKIVLLLSGIVTFLSTHVSALPATDTFKLRQDEGGYVAFDIDGANGQHMTLGLNADGQKYLVSTLHCYDRDAGAAAAGCASTKVSYLPPSWDGYCCEIDWNQCLNQGTIMNGGFTIGKSLTRA